MFKKAFFLITVSLFFHFNLSLAENIKQPDITFKEAKRTFYYNSSYYPGTDAMIIVKGQDDNPLLTPTTQTNPLFGVSIPASSEDVIEVTFMGNIHGNAYFKIVSTGTPCTEIQNMELLTNWSYGYPDDRIYNIFTLKSIFRVTTSGTATFKLQFRQDNLPQPSSYRDLYLDGVLAYAEFVNLPS